MGNYLTTTTIQNFFDPVLLANLTDDTEPADTIDNDNLNAAIDAAEEEFQSRVRQAYSADPLTNITSDTKAYIARIAVYNLFVRRGNVPDWVTDMYNITRLILDRIGKDRNIELKDGLANNNRISVAPLDLDDTDTAFTTDILGV